MKKSELLIPWWLEKREGLIKEEASNHIGDSNYCMGFGVFLDQGLLEALGAEASPVL